MVSLNIQMPASCKSCPYKGERWCYLEVLRGMESQEVPEEGRPDWCPLIDMSQYEDDLK